MLAKEFSAALTEHNIVLLDPSRGAVELPQEICLVSNLRELERAAKDPTVGTAVCLLDRAEIDREMKPLLDFVSSGGYLPVGDRFEKDGFRLRTSREDAALRKVISWLEQHSTFLEESHGSVPQSERQGAALAAGTLSQKVFEMVNRLAGGETKLSRFSTFAQEFRVHTDEATLVGSVAFSGFNIALVGSDGSRILVNSPSVMLVKGQRDLKSPFNPESNPAQEHLSPCARNFPEIEEMLRGTKRLFFQTSAVIQA